MHVHSDSIRAMYKHTDRSLTYLTIITNVSHYHRVGRAGYFSVYVLLVSCECYCFVALSDGGMGCHAVCGCCIS